MLDKIYGSICFVFFQCGVLHSIKLRLSSLQSHKIFILIIFHLNFISFINCVFLSTVYWHNFSTQLVTTLAAEFKRLSELKHFPAFFFGVREQRDGSPQRHAAVWKAIICCHSDSGSNVMAILKPLHSI